MLFTSGLFLFLFLPATLLLFFAIARPAGTRAAASWLAAASLVFYGYWAPVYLVLLAASIAINYLGGLLIWRAYGTPRARTITTLFIAFDLFLLGYFKYYNFFSETLRATGLPLPVLDVALPVGISFFTFTQIAFLVDTLLGKVRRFPFVHYVLFVTYFPHLIAGPVLHHAEIMPQFANPSTYRPRLYPFAIGMAFLLIGLAKKVLIADSISGIADDAFAAAGMSTVGPLHAWAGAIAYSLQIYFDFSGYSDMAIGISMLFGIRLPYNFNSPYRSTSIIDFWRRWHMTLSRFLRDYLYFALGGNRRGKVRRHVNLFATMLLGGLWHGASWTFVAWGALHGIYLIVNHGWRRWVHRRRSGHGLAVRTAGWLVTMLAVVIGWVFFRAANLAEAFNMLQAMAGTLPATDTLETRATHLPLLAAITAIAVFLPNSQTIVMGRLRDAIKASLAHGGYAVAAALGAGCVLIVFLALVAASRANSAFIYFNF